MPGRVLVFDFGISDAGAMLCGYDGGKITLEEIHRFPNTPVTEDGHLRWDIDELFEQIKVGISFGVFNGGFDAISVSAWGYDFGLTDRNGELLEKPVHFLDGRTEGVAEDIFARISPDELYRESGVQPRRINTLFQLAALSAYDRNTLFRAEKMLLIPDLFVYFLTGEYRSEYTGAATTQLIEQSSRGWNIRLIETLGLPKRIFCPIVRPGEVCGGLKFDLAEEFRCDQVPVIACPSHDTAAAVLAVPCEDDRFLFISCGMRAAVGTELRRSVGTPEAMKAGFSNEGGYGDAILLTKEMAGLQLVRECQRYYGGQTAEYGSSVIEFALHCSCFIDPADPMFEQAGSIHGQIAEYCRATGQEPPESAAETMACIYISLACGFASAADSVEQLTGERRDTVYIVGGGAEDVLLCEMTACASGRRVVAGPSDAAALGNGISSLIALGEIKDVKSARRAISSGGLNAEYIPHDAEKWQKILSDYKKIVGKM